MEERAAAIPQPQPPVHAPAFPRSADYLRLLSFVVSNARKGEIMAIENYGEMVHMMPDTDSKIETVHQAKEECKHILLLEKLAKTIGFPIAETMIEPQWNNVRQAFHDAARKNDLAACLIIQDLMVESLAIGLYKLFASAANGDTETQGVAANLLKDELDHLDIGIKRIKGLMEQDSDAVHDALVWAHHKVMPNLFEMVHESCNFLCNAHSLDCDTVDKGTTSIDLEMLKITSLEHYIAMLDAAGFETKVTNRLIASMASYEVPGRSSIGLDCMKLFARRMAN
ncbi:MAG TPA: long-chain fatty aldehyde decarbonylase [Pyrinomonadaceae bacterium]|jgi:fatty aldehyde decarbonylase